MLWANTMKNEAEYIIWHQGNRYILARTESSAVAHAIIEGILNTEIAVSYAEWTNVTEEASTSEYQQYDVINFKIIKAEEPDITTKKMIRLATNREFWLTRLELTIDKYQKRFFGCYDPTFYAWLGTAIARSSPDNIDPLIEEYAIIQEITHAAAYYDLKMRWDSYAMVKVKAYSFFEKFKRMINDCYTAGDMKEILGRCKYELFTMAKI
jgi:hypothetical protein